MILDKVKPFKDIRDLDEKSSILIDLSKTDETKFVIYLTRIKSKTYRHFLRYCLVNDENEVFDKAKSIRINHCKN